MADPLTIADVERIAALARLALSDEEKALYARQLTRILDYASQVAEIVPEGDADLAGDDTARWATGGESLGRHDEARPSLDRASALANAPDSSAGLFRVPKVLGDA
jgi:aspartyl-tRNA(Asn)/glutamyl-tRNA(Gln) amidotransferase subunit C